MIKTQICKQLNIEYPVVLGGMASATSASMVAAVSEAGGLGILGVTGLSGGQIKKEIADIRATTDKPFGINFLMFKIDEEIFDNAMTEKPPVISLAWARDDQDLKSWFDKAHSAGSLVIYMVGDVHEAIRAFKAGADIIVAQGTEGGGHVRSMSTLTLVPMVADAVKPCPLIAAGGVADGRGLAAALALGAEGVLLGTRFLATKEAPIHTNYKEAIVDSDGHDTVLTHIPDLISETVWPAGSARALHNGFIDHWSESGELIKEDMKSLNTASLAARKEGDVNNTSLLVGQNAGLIDSVISVNDVITQMVEDAGEIISGRLHQFTL